MDREGPPGNEADVTNDSANEIPPDPDGILFQDGDSSEFIVTIGVVIALFLLGVLAGRFIWG